MENSEPKDMDYYDQGVTFEDIHGGVSEETPIQDQGGEYDKYTTREHYQERGIY